jgi:hypothetical protein
MFRRIRSLAFASTLLFQATFAFAADAPELLARASGSVQISREGSENPMHEVARSVFWGATAGLLVGSAISLASEQHTSGPLRWGLVLGTFAGLGAGIYFVANRPVPSSSLLELREGRLLPAHSVLSAVVLSPAGVRVQAVGLHF